MLLETMQISEVAVPSQEARSLFPRQTKRTLFRAHKSDHQANTSGRSKLGCVQMLLKYGFMMTKGFLRPLKTRAKVVALECDSDGVIIAATHLPWLAQVSACRANRGAGENECQTRNQGYHMFEKYRATSPLPPLASSKKWRCKRPCVVARSRVQGWTPRQALSCIRVRFVNGKAK